MQHSASSLLLRFLLPYLLLYLLTLLLACSLHATLACAEVSSWATYPLCLKDDLLRTRASRTPLTALFAIIAIGKDRWYI